MIKYFEAGRIGFILNKKAELALSRLIEGNKNFVSCILNSNGRCSKTLKTMCFDQKPFACIVTCSDSRVVPEFVFNAGFGDLFVIRSAGAVIGPNILESVEYAVDVLAVPLVLILGHDDCGVIKYAQDIYPKEPEKFAVLAKSVYDAINNNESFDEIVRSYTILEKNKLLNRSSLLKKAHSNGNFEIVCAYLKFDTGEVVTIE